MRSSYSFEIFTVLVDALNLCWHDRITMKLKQQKRVKIGRVITILPTSFDTHTRTHKDKYVFIFTHLYSDWHSVSQA